MKTTSRVGQGPLTPLLNEPLRRIDDVFHPSRGGVKFPDGIGFAPHRREHKRSSGGFYLTHGHTDVQIDQL
jgi:hypothetical protein